MARGPALAMNQRHMRRVLASECIDGVEPDPALVRRWSRRTFTSYARYWADGARLPYIGEAGVRAKWRLQEGLEHLRAAMADGKGAIVALPHVGSWEWGGYFLALEGMPMTAVVERLEPPQLFDWFAAQRASMGLTAVALGQGSSAAMIRALKNNHLAGLVSDRDMVGNGVEVEFFGEKTTLPGGAATLALRTGAPLIPVVVYSGPGTWHTGIVHPPIDASRRGTLREDIAAGDPRIGHRLRDRHPLPAGAMAHVPTQLAQRPPVNADAATDGPAEDQDRHPDVDLGSDRAPPPPRRPCGSRCSRRIHCRVRAACKVSASGSPAPCGGWDTT